MMYMALIRLTSTRREIRIEARAGHLAKKFNIREGVDYRDALALHGLEEVGRRYDLDEDGDGEVFMVRVMPIEETIYTDRIVVNLDLFHRQVIIWVRGYRVALRDEQAAREAAEALNRAATAACDLSG